MMAFRKIIVKEKLRFGTEDVRLSLNLCSAMALAAGSVSYQLVNQHFEGFVGSGEPGHVLRM